MLSTSIRNQFKEFLKFSNFFLSVLGKYVYSNTQDIESLFNELVIQRYSIANFLLYFISIKLSTSEEENNFYRYLTCYYNKYNQIENETDLNIIEERDHFVLNAVNLSMKNK